MIWILWAVAAIINGAAWVASFPVTLVSVFWGLWIQFLLFVYFAQSAGKQSGDAG